MAGNGEFGFSGDGGLASVAGLHLPYDVAVGEAGNLFIADTENHRIRRVTSACIISTVAGTATAGFSGDRGPATAAQLYNPRLWPARNCVGERQAHPGALKRLQPAAHLRIFEGVP